MEYVFNAFVTLLVIIDPLGLAPIFAALTKGFSGKHKRESAIRGTVLGGLILYVFALAGDVLLEALGIGLPAFRIAGGILLFLLSLDMVFARPSGLRASAVREQEEDQYQQDISVFPLASPSRHATSGGDGIERPHPRPRRPARRPVRPVRHRRPPHEPCVGRSAKARS
jgi:multiple antibiotic resistance protein